MPGSAELTDPPGRRPARRPTTRRSGRPRLHWAWLVAGVALVALIGAGAFRAAPSVLIDPLQEEFGWSRGTISAAVSVNLLLYGLTAPFAAALMERYGLRRVISGALLLVAVGSGLTILMTASWQLILCWGVLVGLGTGSMSLALVATVTGRWFERRRGLVTGVLTAGGATGQLIFLPLIAYLAVDSGWRVASLLIAAAAAAVVPLTLTFVREYPRDIGLRPYGAPDSDPADAADVDASETTPTDARSVDPEPLEAMPTGPESLSRPARGALAGLAMAVRSRTFWLLAGGFAICGMSTNGLVGTHFVPAAHDHGMPVTTAAGLLALVGVFDIGGTILSGWLTDRIDSRLLLGAYYTLRGGSLIILPRLFDASAHPSMIVFIVFYGLDWVATVPPTITLCRKHFRDAAPVVFGWVFASHQVGAAIAAVGAGLIRDHSGDYALAWYLAGGLCAFAALMSVSIRGANRGVRGMEPVAH